MGRLILPNSRQDNQESASSIYPQETGLLGQLGQGALDIGASLAGIPGSLLESGRNSEFAKSINQQRGGNVFNPSLPTSERLVSGARNLTGYTEPQTAAQRFAYNAGSYVPGAAATILSGGAVAPALASATGAAAGKTAAEELGLGTVGEIALSAIGGGLGSSLARGGTKGVAQQVIPIRRESYKKAEEYGKKLPLGKGTAQVQKDILSLESNAEKALGGPLHKKYYKQILHDTKNLTEKVENGTADVWDLVNAKQKFNDIAYDYKIDNKVRNAFGDAREVLNSTIRKFEETYPQFGQEYRKAENLTTFIKGSEQFKDFFKKNKEIEGLLTELPNEVTHIIKQLGSTNSLPKLLFKTAASPIGVPLKYGATEYKNARELLSNPATSELLNNLYRGIAEDNVPTVVRSLLSLTGNADEQPESKPQRGTTPGRGRLILPQ